MIPQWFLYLQGFAMVIMGASLLVLRPRQPGDSLYRKFVNLGTLWAVVCTGVGIALLALALGYVRWPGPPPVPPAIRAHRR